MLENVNQGITKWSFDSKHWDIVLDIKYCVNDIKDQSEVKTMKINDNMQKQKYSDFDNM